MNTLKFKLRFVFSLLFTLPLLSGTAGAAMQSSITQYGITWNFNGSYEVGQFATGDWWVVGPVTITSVSPSPTGTRNGSSVNPMPNRQGYDSRGGRYNTTDNVTFPYTLQVNHCLVSSDSRAEGVAIRNIGCLQTQAVLTAVSSAQSASALRPSYAGTYKKYFNTSQIQWSLLPDLTPPGSEPDGAALAALLDPPRIDHIGSWLIQDSCAGDNWTNIVSHPCYGRDYSKTISAAALFSLLDDPDRDDVVLALIQIGIDNYGVLRAGGKWPADGGHESGRKFPIILAGILLNDADMLSVGVSYDDTFFGEDGQTYYGVGNIARFGQDCPASKQGYFQNGCSGSGSKDCRDPNGTSDGCPDYRNCCTSSTWVGEALTVLALNGKAIWSHDAFFDYVDRWMDGDVSGSGGGAWDDFSDDMWLLYRDDVPLAGGGGQVAAPLFSPVGGNYTSSQSVSISTTTSGATIRYTTNGSTPTSSSGTVYSSPVSISSNTTLKAIAYKGGMSDSSVSSDVYTFYPAGSIVATSGDPFKNSGFTAQTDTFTATFTAEPSSAATDCVMGLSEGTAAWYSDLAAIVRFNPSGAIDARNGSSYQADNTISYTANTSYDFRLVVDIGAGTYSAYVTPEGGSEWAIGTDYAFRTEQSAVTSLDSWSIAITAAATGTSVVASDISVATEADTTAPSVPTGLSYSNLTDTTVDLDWNASTDNVAVAGYKIYTNGSNPVSLPGTSVTIAQLSPSTGYSFTVSAFDGAGNESSQSSAVNVTTDDPAAVVISEDFASSAANFTAVSGGTWSVSGGRYVLSSPVQSGTEGTMGNISVHDTRMSDNYELNAVMRITGTGSSWNDAAILFDYQDASNYYYVSLNESNDGNTKGIFKVVSGSPTQLADITISVTSDTDYPITIVRNGASIVAEVNSSQVATASDSTFAGGKVGFGSYNDGAQFDNLVVTGEVADAEAPSVPTGLTAGTVTITSVELNWNASTDNVGVAGYKVYTNGSSPVTVSGTGTTISNLSAGTSYTFTVTAFDGDNNESDESDEVVVITDGLPVPSTVQITASTNDQEVWDTGGAKWVGQTNMRIGGTTTSTDACGVFPFELPELPAGQTVIGAVFTIKLEGITNGPSGVVDLYGLDYRSTSTVSAATDFYEGTYNGDATASTGLMSSFATTSSPTNTIMLHSSANLTNYINAQYTAGAGEGDFVFLRLSPSNTNVDDNRYWIFSSANSTTSANRPTLILHIGPNLLENGEFDSGTSDWAVANFNGASSSLSAATGQGLSGNNSMQVSISNGGTAYHSIQVYQDVEIVDGQSYSIWFRAKAAATKDIRVVIQDYESPYSEYWNEDITVTTSPQLFGPYTFNSTVSDATARFKFFVGTNTTTIYIDEVSIVQTEQ